MALTGGGGGAGYKFLPWDHPPWADFVIQECQLHTFCDSVFFVTSEAVACCCH